MSSTPRSPRPRRPGPDTWQAGIRAGDHGLLARAITLVESTRPDDRTEAQALLHCLLPHSGHAWRIGLTGPPGAGKSTLIDVLGGLLIARGRKVAVLTVDPSSPRTGGSILGDKTRMHALSVNPAAFIRPSPSSGAQGGVAPATCETMILCEAAGFDVIIVETVGAGQSEVSIAAMTDTFLVLAAPGAGDTLQGIKKGVLELADIIAVNKADASHLAAARATAADLRAALALLDAATQGQADSGEEAFAPVLLCSALEGTGLAELATELQRRHERLAASGALERKRMVQRVAWMRTMLEQRLLDMLRRNTGITAWVQEMEDDVAAGRITPMLAVERILKNLSWEPSAHASPAQGADAFPAKGARRLPR